MEFGVWHGRSWKCSCSPTSKPYKSSPFEAFMENSLHMHGWLNHWPLIIDLTFSHYPFFWKWWNGTQISMLSFLVDSLGNKTLSLGAFQKSSHYHECNCGGKGLIKKNRALISPLWFWGDFRTWGQETKYNKSYSHCSYCSANSKSLGTWELGTVDEEQIYTRSIFWPPNEQIYNS